MVPLPVTGEGSTIVLKAKRVNDSANIERQKQQG